jgi:hypothetical protein
LRLIVITTFLGVTLQFLFLILTLIKVRWLDVIQTENRFKLLSCLCLVLIRSGRFTLQLNGNLTKSQTLSFGYKMKLKHSLLLTFITLTKYAMFSLCSDPTINATQCPQFIYEIPWINGTNSSQILNISTHS